MKRTLPLCLLVGLLQPTSSLPEFSRLAIGHEQTREQFAASRQAALAKSRQHSEQLDETSGATAVLTVELWDEQAKNAIPGLLQVTNVDSGKTIELEGQIHREWNWSYTRSRARNLRAILLPTSTSISRRANQVGWRWRFRVTWPGMSSTKNCLRIPVRFIWNWQAGRQAGLSTRSCRKPA